MTRRLLIQGGSDHPIRISASSGGDAGSADALSLIFEGNQSPLRIATSGYLYCPGIGLGNAAVAYATATPAPVYSAPPGQYPLFCVAERKVSLPTLPAQTPFRLSGGALSGFGGALSGGYFLGLNFTTSTSTPEAVAAYITYLIFRNQG